jgi:hypothetical protein
MVRFRNDHTVMDKQMRNVILQIQQNQDGEIKDVILYLVSPSMKPHNLYMTLLLLRELQIKNLLIKGGIS